MPSWLEHPRSPDEPDEPRYGIRAGKPPGPAEGHYANGSTEFHGAGPVPEGFGFRTGMRSARAVLGFAWLVLIMATLLLVMGAIIFIGRSSWIAVIILCLLELGFIAVFFVLAALARQRRGQHD
ncbi:MAG: hypothetical protein L0I99_04335 [Micrococcaceae bacterium]|uniref:hypothetical protein n=1 Tax=Arthrobacter sp. 179 TaxID=3457734 RepID=UPI0026545587|nr:hypothetical protein [Micrococcaceae bacterium]